MIIDEKLLDQVTAEAQASPRLRMIRAITGSMPNCFPIPLKSAFFAAITHFSFNAFPLFPKQGDS